MKVKVVNMVQAEEHLELAALDSVIAEVVLDSVAVVGDHE